MKLITYYQTGKIDVFDTATFTATDPFKRDGMNLITEFAIRFDLLEDKNSNEGLVVDVYWYDAKIHDKDNAVTCDAACFYASATSNRPENYCSPTQSRHQPHPYRDLQPSGGASEEEGSSPSFPCGPSPPHGSSHGPCCRRSPAHTRTSVSLSPFVRRSF